MEDLFKRIPKQNDKHNDTKNFVDYRKMILEDYLNPISQASARVIVKMIDEKDEEWLERFIFGVAGI